MRLSRSLLPLILAALGAGCIASAVPTVEPASAGSGGYALVVRVTDEPHGPVVEGARVSVTIPAEDFWGGRAAQVVQIATGPDGVATARVDGPAQALVRVEAPGYTRETVADVPVEDAGQGSLTVPLYHERATLVVKDVLAPAAASTHRAGWGDFEWQPHAITFGSNDDARRGYAQRLVLLNATLEWTNTPLASGDLGIALGKSPSRADVVQDAGSLQLPPGSYKESLSLTPSDFRRAHWESATTLYVGAGTGTAYVAPQGLGYAIKVDAVFDGDQARHESPGPSGLMGALGGLAIAALVLRRPAS